MPRTDWLIIASENMEARLRRSTRVVSDQESGQATAEGVATEIMAPEEPISIDSDSTSDAGEEERANKDFPGSTNRLVEESSEKSEYGQSQGAPSDYLGDEQDW